ncbi:MAG: thiamine diphosphokinase [Acidimicrobiales bacterium]
MGADHAIVVASGAVLPDAARAGLRVDAYVVAADGGVDAALAMGLTIDVAIGDLDSVTDAGLERAVAMGARVERHPEAKDATDLELALDAAVALGARDIVVLAADGGRFDHLLATVDVLTAPNRSGVRLEAWFGANHLWVVTAQTPAHIVASPGALVTLLPVHGPALGVHAEGFLYALRAETLSSGTSRGVSNVLIDTSATVGVEEGTVLVVVPPSHQGDQQ